MKFNKYVKLILAIFCIEFFSCVKLFAQSDFDNKLNVLSDTIANKINSKGKKIVAVWDFTDADGQVTNLGKYISEEISINLTNSAVSFNMMDRNHLNTILKEHKLNAEGFIDANTAKELGKMNAVDAIVTGNVTIFGDKIKLSIKVLDTETALIIAATKGELPMTKEISTFLGVPDLTVSNSGNLNRGFNNRPLNSNEQYNNPETVNKECQELKTGDYCFTNNTDIKLLIIIGDSFHPNNHSLTLEPKQQQCLYNLKCGPINYSYSEVRPYNGSPDVKAGHGQILIEQCKSKTMIIN